jgi:hypothetical protein
MIRERILLSSDGTVDGTYWTTLCPRCVERARSEPQGIAPESAVVVPIQTAPTPDDDTPSPELLDYQKFLIDRKSRKS